MRFIIYGAGAIGATIGARLRQSGREVVLIARGSHGQTLRERGLRFESHAGVEQLTFHVVEHPSELSFQADDLVVLAMKTQSLTAALEELAAVVPHDFPIACAQNGIEAERLALRRFARVYAMAVLVPAVYLEPGAVQAFATPLTGVVDLGRYPHGRDPICLLLSAALRDAGFASEVRDDIQRLKQAKLLSNLGNAIEALCGPSARKGPVAELVRKEALRVLHAAGMDPDVAGASPALGGRGRTPACGSGSAGWIVVAKLVASDGQHRNGLPQRRDRAPRATAWGADASQSRGATPREPIRAGPLATWKLGARCVAATSRARGRGGEGVSATLRSAASTSRSIMKVPGPDHPITIAPNPKRVVVRVGGKTIADTTRALALREASYPAVQYIPRADVDMTALQRTDHATHCPYKGDASYYSIRLGGGGKDLANAVWTYESAYEAVKPIEGHLAFYPNKVELTEEEGS